MWVHVYTYAPAASLFTLYRYRVSQVGVFSKDLMLHFSRNHICTEAHAHLTSSIPSAIHTDPECRTFLLYYLPILVGILPEQYLVHALFCQEPYNFSSPTTSQTEMSILRRSCCSSSFNITRTIRLVHATLFFANALYLE